MDAPLITRIKAAMAASWDRPLRSVSDMRELTPEEVASLLKCTTRALCGHLDAPIEAELDAAISRLLLRVVELKELQALRSRSSNAPADPAVDSERRG